MDLALKGKYIIVTGAANGIGAQTCIQLADEGVNLICVDIDEKGLDDISEICIQKNVQVLKILADVSQKNDVRKMRNLVKEKYGTVYGLVNNAGIISDHLLEMTTEEIWDQVINTDLKGVFLCTQVIIGMMRVAKMGSIVNISSIIAKVGNSGQANYSAAKAGVVGFTKTIAKEYAPFNVRVNAVLPGLIQTSMAEKIPLKFRIQLQSQIPFNRLGTSEEVANVILFLLSERASYVTGSLYEVAGGLFL